MVDFTELIGRINDEAELCCNEGADDISRLLVEASVALGSQALEIEALRADAGRHRWLRENGMYGAPKVAVKDGYGGKELAMGDYLDAAIDAAMSAEKGVGL